MSFSACPSGRVRAALAKACADLNADEEFDVLDVYRRLAQEAKIVYDTEKIQARMKDHPLTGDVALKYPALVDFVVENLKTHVDAERNTATTASVVFSGAASQPSSATKRQKTKEHLEWSFAYDRRYAGEPFGTTLTFTVGVAMGYGKKQRLLHIVLRFSGHYPASYYQKKEDDGDAPVDVASHEDAALGQDERGTSDKDSEAEEEGTASGSDEDQAQEEEAEEDEAEHDEGQGAQGDEENDSDGDEATQELHVLGPDEKNWEYVEEFEFHEDVFEMVHAWFGGDLSHQDFLTFFLAFPFTEDEYMVDDRIFDLVFNGDSDSEDD
ncbi:hypothetical protein ACHHYP_11239 [Achlya hypogyna]|uniref:Uncharacterized protein n=1 Tax=Achlya hypogyna TaxID=1202772 RepID=A0A1V9YJF4_ACHHY|nr:hypothetical protein ACHHYP_11239 [Achlya hypogyna]